MMWFQRLFWLDHPKNIRALLQGRRSCPLSRMGTFCGQKRSSLRWPLVTNMKRCLLRRGQQIPSQSLKYSLLVIQFLHKRKREWKAPDQVQLTRSWPSDPSKITTPTEKLRIWSDREHALQRQNKATRQQAASLPWHSGVPFDCMKPIRNEMNTK